MTEPAAPDPILEALLSDEEDEATYKLLAAMHEEDEGQTLTAPSSSENRK